LRYRPSQQLRKTFFGATAIFAVVAMNAPAATGYVVEKYHQHKINQPGYKAARGHWDVVDVPARYRLNVVHAALLRTGKVLLIAGSGNDQRAFDTGTFRSVLWDPSAGTFREIPTPEDLFCAGHAQLPDGRLLVAGGTARYEVPRANVTRAAGPMLVKNENPAKGHTFRRGTVFRARDGRAYRSVRAFSLPPARMRKHTTAEGRMAVKVTASQVRTFVEAVRTGRGQTRSAPAQFRIAGLRGADARNLYGLGERMTLDTQRYQGIRSAYEFDPVAERYVRVAPMSEARWYPTLVPLRDGQVMAVSGLDDVGQITGGHSEIFDPRTRTWSKGPTRYFPTYPALFLTRGGKLFFSGSTAGYGPADRGRVPGMWNPRRNTFVPVKGLRDPRLTETSASVLLPPAQRQRVMILGGGGAGESPRSTARTAVADLSADRPRFRRGPDLPADTRYLSAVLLPNDTVLATGGSSDYRGRGASDVRQARFYDPRANSFLPAADPTVGRGYHSSALLLPDGRVATFGSDPQFSDRKNTVPGRFEQRVEVYSPPYLFHGERPAISGGPREVRQGGTARFRVRHAADVTEMRLMRPSAVTHSTDVQQRSVRLPLTHRPGSVRVSVPRDASLVPRGWYMLFAVDKAGTPSRARWVHVR
jgi:Domain of unknown function (DUF1929)